MYDTPSQGILKSKKTLAVVLIACVIEIVLSVKSLTVSVTTSRDWVRLAGVLFAAMIFVSLTARVRTVQERFVFGSGSVALCLLALLSVAAPSIEVILVARWVILLAWISAMASGITLLRRKQRPK
jgi:uncharacterized membrane protein